jgi:hypothetical protein
MKKKEGRELIETASVLFNPQARYPPVRNR